MSATITQIDEHLTGMLHGGSLNKVRNKFALYERAANNVLARTHPIDTIRNVPLTDTVHDDVFNYALAADFRDIIDLRPQAARITRDRSVRQFAETFDLTKAFARKQISIESRNGTRFIRINWRRNPPKVYHNMDSLTANGTWSVVGSATGLKIQTLYFITGTKSTEFDLVATGDGIQNTSATALDLEDEDEIADPFIWIYFPATTNVTSVTGIWGNDLTTNFWTGVAQTTQADGTAFKTGWNRIKWAWSAATETGTVDPSAIDSFRITIAATGAVSNIRVDSIMFSVGTVFDLIYYSKFAFQNSSGTWIARPTATDGSDVVVFDDDAINIFLNECLILAAHQVEGEDSGFDISFARQELYDPTNGLYKKYNAQNPSQIKKQVGTYYKMPNFRQ